MNKEKKSTILPTHNIGVSMTRNTKYLSRNPISQWLIGQFMKNLTDLASLAAPHTILDIGCGEGVVIRQLLAIWNKRQVNIYGTDLQVEAFQVIQQITTEGNYFVSNIYHPPLQPHYYDLVICMEVLEHLDNPEIALQKIEKLTKKYCLLSVPHEPLWRMANMIRGRYLSDLGNTPRHVNHWSRKGFIEFVGNHFQIETIRSPFPWTMILARVK